jgi:hypothetical protein
MMILGLHHITLIYSDAQRTIDFYTRDPDGHIIELATAGPGFLIDENILELDTKLNFPPWLKHQRESIEGSLKPINTPICQADEVHA